MKPINSPGGLPEEPGLSSASRGGSDPKAAEASGSQPTASRASIQAAAGGVAGGGATGGSVRAEEFWVSG